MELTQIADGYIVLMFLMGAVEGKLPIIKADGTVKPIEMTFTLKYDPTTGSFDIVKQ